MKHISYYNSKVSGNSCPIQVTPDRAAVSKLIISSSNISKDSDECHTMRTDRQRSSLMHGSDDCCSILQKVKSATERLYRCCVHNSSQWLVRLLGQSRVWPVGGAWGMSAISSSYQEGEILRRTMCPWWPGSCPVKTNSWIIHACCCNLPQSCTLKSPFYIIRTQNPERS